MMHIAYNILYWFVFFFKENDYLFIAIKFRIYENNGATNVRFYLPLLL